MTKRIEAEWFEPYMNFFGPNREIHVLPRTVRILMTEKWISK